MRSINKNNLILGALCGFILQPINPAFSQDEEVEEIEEVVVIGSRVAPRTATESPVPVDVFQGEELNRNGSTELGQALQSVAPSFNFSRTQVSDGSDLYRPATLRGLQPDQTLVLINGKRRHSQAIFGLAGTVGAGAVGTDMNAIPLSALSSVEVLRDGAAAQYGSDAIAGVINLQLKETTDTTGFLKWGQTTEGDGMTTTLGLNSGFTYGNNGFFNFTFEYRDGERTNRAQRDIGGSSTVEPGNLSSEVRWHQGDADTEFKTVFYNTAFEIGNGEIYSFGGYSNRTALGSGFYRDFNRASRNVPQVYPDGFLPQIDNEGEDKSIALGYKQDLNDAWSMDVSVNNGSNDYSFHSRNTINASIAAGYLLANPGASDAEIAANAGPTSGFSGGIDFSQLTFNFDVSGSLELPNQTPLYIATGIESRREDYEIIRGELASYSCGPNDEGGLLVSVIDGQTIAECGFQAYNGLRAATKADRKSFSAYIDLETNITDNWLMGLASRYEDYDNVDSEVTYKFTNRFEINDKFAVRMALASGFRAPSLQQTAYTAFTTTIGPDGNLTNSFTAPAGSALPTALGVPNLDSETSTSGSFGFIGKPTDNLTFTLDWYQVKIKDRITLGGFLNADDLAGNAAALEALEASGVSQAAFFSNALNTTTRGIDLVIEHDKEFENSSLKTTFVMNINETDIDRINAPDGVTEAQISPTPTRSFITGGQPQERATLAFNWTRARFDTLLRFNYFGETEVDYFARNHIGIPGTLPTSVVESALLVDLDVTYDISDNFNISVGVNNIFDEVPDELGSNEVLDIISNQAFRYPLRAVPYGFNGAFYYVKLDFEF